MIFRIRYQAIEPVPHVFCALYVAKEEGQTGALCGSFTMRKNEFKALQEAFPKAEFVKEEWHGDK